MFEFHEVPSPRAPGGEAEEAPIGVVYAIRTPDDLKHVCAITRPRSLQPIGEFLFARGVLTDEELSEALAMQRHMQSRRLGWILQTLGHFDDVTLGRLLACHQGVPCVSLHEYRASWDERKLLPESAAKDSGIAVLHDEPQCSWVAVADVTDAHVIDEASAILGKRLVTVMAAPRDIVDFYFSDRRGRSGAYDPHYSGEERRKFLMSAGLPADTPWRSIDGN